MSTSFDNDELDRLLAQPARLADNGFVDRLNARIRYHNSRLRAVFAVLACLWLVLAFAFGAVSQLIDALVTASLYWSRFIESLLTGSVQDIQLPAEYGLLIGAVCMLIAVATLLIKD